MKKNIVNNDFTQYVIDSDKIRHDSLVIIIDNLSNLLQNKKKCSDMIEKIKMTNPHHLIIVGDILEVMKWTNSKIIDNYYYFLSSVSESVPIFLIFDKYNLYCNNIDRRIEMMDRFKKFANIRSNSIYSLINDKIYFDGFEIIGYIPSYEITNQVSSVRPTIDHDKFIAEYTQYGHIIDHVDQYIIEFFGYNPFNISHLKPESSLGELSMVDTFYTSLENIQLSNNDFEHAKYFESAVVEDSESLFHSKSKSINGIVYLDDLSRHVILQLSNHRFYYNISCMMNKQEWITISHGAARDIIINKRLHSLIFTSGIEKKSPRVMQVLYKRLEKKL